MRRSFLALQQAPRVVPSNEDERMGTCFELVLASTGKEMSNSSSTLVGPAVGIIPVTPGRPNRFWK
jgi:hypothetical protein